MAEERKIVIDLDVVAEDAEALAKLYECASLMVQSANPRESALGYRMLDIVGEAMKPADKTPRLSN